MLGQPLELVSKGRISFSVGGLRFICKESLLMSETYMATEEIVKVTSKGQLTIPADIRRELRLDDGSYVYMKALGKLIVMRKVNDLNLKEISAILEEIAKEKGLTRAVLLEEVERVRMELWKERYGKTESTP